MRKHVTFSYIVDRITEKEAKISVKWAYISAGFIYANILSFLQPVIFLYDKIPKMNQPAV